MSLSQPSPLTDCAVPLLTVGVLLISVGAMTVPVTAVPSPAAITNVTHTPATPTAGETFEVQLSVQNYEGSGRDLVINEIYVQTSDGRGYESENLGGLTPGSSMMVTLPVRLEDPGWHTFTIRLNGETSNGIVTIEHPVTVRVVGEPRPSVDIRTEKAVSGATRPVNVTVANGDEINLRDVVVTVSSSSAEFSVNRRVKARLPSGNETTFVFPASVASSGTHPVDVTVQYSENGETHQFSQQFQAAFDSPLSPGAVRLTGIETTRRSGTVELSATASNIGSTPVDGVVVTIDGTERVAAADYFVGSIQSSDFSSFTLSTDADKGVTDLSVTIRYVVDGVERTFSTSVPVDQQAPVRPAAANEAKGGPPLLLLGGLGVAVSVAGLLIFRWQR